MKTIPIENRQLLILEQAESINNYIDCDVIHYNIKKVKESKTLEDIMNFTRDLINAIGFRGGNTKGIANLLLELESIHIKNLIAV